MLLAAAAAVTVAGTATPGYDPLRDPISLLASDGQPRAVVMRAVLAVAALAALACGRRLTTTPGRALLVTAAVAGVVLAFAPKDLPDHAPDTLASQVHVAAAAIGGAAIVAAMAVERSTRAAIATVLLAIAFERTWGTGVHGLAERALVAVPLAWLVTLR